MSIQNPNKIFSCDCCGEGLVVSVERDADLEDVSRGPFINIAFWENSRKYSGDKLSLWERVKFAWHILRGKSPWTDMVMMSSDTARKFANHILYLLGRDKPKLQSEKQEPLVKD